MAPSQVETRCSSVGSCSREPRPHCQLRNRKLLVVGGGDERRHHSRSRPTAQQRHRGCSGDRVHGDKSPHLIEPLHLQMSYEDLASSGLPVLSPNTCSSMEWKPAPGLGPGRAFSRLIALPGVPICTSEQELRRFGVGYHVGAAGGVCSSFETISRNFSIPRVPVWDRPAVPLEGFSALHAEKRASTRRTGGTRVRRSPSDISSPMEGGEARSERRSRAPPVSS